MSEKKVCPVCGMEHEITPTEWGDLYRCTENRCYKIHQSVFYAAEPVELERRLNVIYNFVEEKPYDIKSGFLYYWEFFYEATNEISSNERRINVFHLMKNYPYQVIDRLDSILLNLAKDYPLLSDVFQPDALAELRFRRLYSESNERDMEILSIFSALFNYKYIEVARGNGRPDLHEYRIALNGWKRIAELRKTNGTSTQGFIAMSFAPEAKYIEDAIKAGIVAANFNPQIIKDKEHNNYIMPEIFHEISKSRFLVVDITIPNYGAYYEAGYAQALGKEVIVCCQKQIFDDPTKRPHFDIAQKSMIVWNDPEDLIERLKNRITATVK